jgi:hypothetical protein
MKVIKAVVEDKTLSPAEKVLFVILYCRKEGSECTLSVQELVHYLGSSSLKRIAISLMPAAFSHARFWEKASNTKSRMFPVHEFEVYC